MIVKEVLGRRVVDRDHRKPQGAVGRHGPKPDDPGGRLLGGSDRIEVGSFGVEEGGEVGAIVHGDVGRHVEDGVDVPVVALLILAPDREHRDVVGHQSGRHIVLGRERIRGAQRHGGPPVTEGEHEVGGLGGDVETGGDRQPFQRLFLEKALPDRLQHRHPAPGPLDAAGTLRGEVGIGDVVVQDASLAFVGEFLMGEVGSFFRQFAFQILDRLDRNRVDPQQSGKLEGHQVSHCRQAHHAFQCRFSLRPHLADPGHIAAGDLGGVPESCVDPWRPRPDPAG